MKALKIDVTTKKVYEIEIVDWTDIAPSIGNGCTTFCAPYEFENMDTLYSDDEGLLHNVMIGGFKIPSWNVPLVGNAIILGSDDEGDSQDYKSSIDKITSLISWFSPEFSETYRDSVMEQPSFIYYKN